MSRPTGSHARIPATALHNVDQEAPCVSQLESRSPFQYPCSASVPAGIAAETIRIAHIDPISGPFGNVGQSLGRHLQAVVDDINARAACSAERKLELINLDNKSSPQDSVLVLQQAIDQGIRYVTQANGSNIAHALTDAVAKHNARNPDQAVLYLNFGAIDPALTNEKCNFWHFRFDANVDMKIEALTNYMTQQHGIQKLYLINQDYAFGQSVSRVGKAMLAQKRPDIQIVGDDLHPIGKVKDFSPYVAKIKASGADTVLTGNWGNDLSLLVKAGKEAGLTVELLRPVRLHRRQPHRDRRVRRRIASRRCRPGTRTCRTTSWRSSPTTTRRSTAKTCGSTTQRPSSTCWSKR